MWKRFPDHGALDGVGPATILAGMDGRRILAVCIAFFASFDAAAVCADPSEVNYVADPARFRSDIDWVLGRLRSSPGLETLRVKMKRDNNVDCIDSPAAAIAPQRSGQGLGTIELCPQLAEIVANRDQIAFVLAHEAGHLFLRHTEKTRVVADAMVARHPGAFRGITDAQLKLQQEIEAKELYPFELEQEREADTFATDLIYKLGFDAQSAARSMRDFERWLAGKSNHEHHLATHGSGFERAQRIIERSENLGSPF